MGGIERRGYGVKKQGKRRDGVIGAVDDAAAIVIDDKDFVRDGICDEEIAEVRSERLKDLAIRTVNHDDLSVGLGDIHFVVTRVNGHTRESFR